MHIQTKDGQIGEFWDVESRAIQVSGQKGLHRNSAFAFDWHWRGETTAEQRGSCSTAKWPMVQRELHDELSQDILEILPLPILLIAGTCVRNKYRRTLSNMARRLELAVSPMTSIEVDLDFRADGLRRMTVYMDHPSASDFQPARAEQRSTRQDASINLCVWLTGQTCNPTAFSHTLKKHRRGVGDTSPLKPMWRSIKLEQEIGGVLGKESYNPFCWKWAGRVLNKDPAIILEEGGSVALAVRHHCHQRKLETENLPEQMAMRRR